MEARRSEKKKWLAPVFGQPMAGSTTKNRLTRGNALNSNSTAETSWVSKIFRQAPIKDPGGVTDRSETPTTREPESRDPQTTGKGQPHEIGVKWAQLQIQFNFFNSREAGGKISSESSRQYLEYVGLQIGNRKKKQIDLR